MPKSARVHASIMSARSGARASPPMSISAILIFVGVAASFSSLASDSSLAYDPFHVGDRVEVREMATASLHDCISIILQVIEPGPKVQYKVHRRCMSDSKKTKTVKVGARGVTLLDMAQDESEVYFVRPGGAVEVKSVIWCRTHGFFQVGDKFWAGDWWDTLPLEQRESLLDRDTDMLATHMEVTGYDLLESAGIGKDVTDGELEEEEDDDEFDAES